MWEKIKKDLSKYTNKTGVLNVFKVMLLNSGFRAVFIYRISHELRLKNYVLISSFLDRVNHHVSHCWISSTARIGAGFCIRHVCGIVIGGKVEVGENFEIRQNTTLGGNNGKTRDCKTQPVIGDNVTLGCNTSVLGPVIVGNNVFVGAHSLVLSDCDSNAIYAGVPVKKIREL